MSTPQSVSELLASRRAEAVETVASEPIATGAQFFSNVRQGSLDRLEQFLNALDARFLLSDDQRLALEKADALPENNSNSKNFLRSALVGLGSDATPHAGKMGNRDELNEQSEIQTALTQNVLDLASLVDHPDFKYGVHNSPSSVQRIDQAYDRLKKEACDKTQEWLGRFDEARPSIEAYVDTVLNSRGLKNERWRQPFEQAIKALLDSQEDQEKTAFGKVVFAQFRKALQNDKKQSFDLFYLEESKKSVSYTHL